MSFKVDAIKLLKTFCNDMKPFKDGVAQTLKPKSLFLIFLGVIVQDSAKVYLGIEAKRSPLSDGDRVALMDELNSE